MSSYGETLESQDQHCMNVERYGETCTEKHQKDKTDTALNSRMEKRLQEKTIKL